MPQTSRRSTRSPQAKTSTDERLVRAAMEEFRRGGFSGTDSNRIARRAGFAPQTFYRWYADKTAVFLAAYRQWEEAEQDALDSLASRRASAPRLADAVVKHHRDYLMFRRSLRQLAVEDPAVRQARAQSRLRQVERIRQRLGLDGTRNSVLAISLLQIERLADALAEGEFEDLGVDAGTARQAIAGLIRKLSE